MSELDVDICMITDLKVSTAFEHPERFIVILAGEVDWDNLVSTCDPIL